VSVGVFVWAALRLFGLLRAQALWRAAVGPSWEIVAAALAGCVAFAVVPATTDVTVTMSTWLLVAVCEFLLGSVVGVLLSLPGQALLAAAGQGAATMNVPRGGLVVVFAVASLVGGLTVDLHHPLLFGLQQQLTQWPVGEPARWGHALVGLDARVIAAAHGYLVLALALATPVLLSVAVVDLTLRLTVRGVASTSGDVLRPWLATTAALVALGGAWAAYPEAWQRAWGAA
jgi:flagellar biosynthesis protein FliR